MRQSTMRLSSCMGLARMHQRPDQHRHARHSPLRRQAARAVAAQVAFVTRGGGTRTSDGPHQDTLCTACNPEPCDPAASKRHLSRISTMVAQAPHLPPPSPNPGTQTLSVQNVRACGRRDRGAAHRQLRVGIARPNGLAHHT